MITENCIKKWRTTGLLEGLSGEPESRCAEVLENAAVEIIKQGHEGRTVELLFPVIRRMAGEGFYPSDAAWLVEDFQNWMKTRGSHIDFCFTVEAEVEFCAQYSTECPERFSRRNNVASN
jgi:hypothetical protein